MILYTGDDWIIPFSYSKDNDVYDITNITEISSCFKAADGSIISVLLSVGEIVISSALGGKGTITVPKGKTMLIKPSTQSLTVIRTDSTGKEFTHVIEDLLEITKRPC